MKHLINTLVLLFAAALSVHGQASFFDPTFGTGGQSRISLVGTDNGWFEAIAMQSDDKIVGVGGVPGYGRVFRFKANGGLDSSFGDNGIYYCSQGWIRTTDVEILPDGKIIAAGELNDSFYVTRLLPDGTPDLSFNGTGEACIGFGMFVDGHGQTVATQTDGKIVMGGDCAAANMGFARFLPNGAPDNSFGTNGVVVGPYGRVNGICVTPDGKIIGGGHATASMGYKLMVAKYLANGTLDTSFNHTGIVYTLAGDPGGNFGRALYQQPDGKILLAGTGGFGSEGGNFVVVRYNPDGSLDGSFGAGGIANVDFYGEDDDCRGMYVTADGKILLTGMSGENDHYKFAVARLMPNGTLDNTFGVSGRILNAIGVRSDYARDVAVQSTGKVIVAGNTVRTMTETYGDPVLVRYFGSNVSVTHIDEPAQVTLFPNPCSKCFYIHSKKEEGLKEISLYNVMGRRVLVASIGPQGAVDVSILSPGIYLCKIITENQKEIFDKIKIY